MAKIRVGYLLELVKRSKLLTESRVERGVEQAKQDNGGTIPHEVDQIVDSFIEQGLLTRWQCDKLLEKKYKEKSHLQN